MNSSQVNFTQTLSFESKPFRQNVLDYSFSKYVNVLDSFAGSLLVICLAATLVHLSGFLLGMSTRSVVVGSLREKYFFPNIFCLLQFCTTSSEDFRKKKIYCISQLIAGCFISVLLAIEVFIIFSNTPVEQSVSLEDLRIRWPQFSSYDGSLQMKQLPDNCYPFYSTERSVSTSPLGFCVHTSSFSVPERDPEIVRIFFQKSTMRHNLLYGCQKNGTLIVQSILIALQLNVIPVALKTYMLIDDKAKFLPWIGRNIQSVLQCQNYSVVVEQGQENNDDIENILFTDCKERTENNCNKVTDLLFGTLRFSKSTLRRDDFAQLQLDETTYKPQHLVKPTGVNWDAFASFRRSRVPGYILWLCALFLLFINAVLSLYAPDLLMVKQIAAYQHLRLDDMPVCLEKHKNI